MLQFDSTLRELDLHHFDAITTKFGNDLLKLFRDNLALPGVILLEANLFVGMISRRSFYELMSRPYGLDLFSRRALVEFYRFINREPLVLSSEMSVVAAARRALQRSPDDLYEPIVVHLESNQYRVLEMHHLLLAQSQIQNLALTALKESQQALAHEKELAQVTLHSIGDGIITTDAAGYVTALNPVAERLTGWQSAMALKQPLAKVFCILDETQGLPLNPLELVRHEKSVRHSWSCVLLQSQNGQIYEIDYSAAPILMGIGEVLGTVLVFRDVTQQRRLARQISWQASHDALTELINRREFERRLQATCEHAKDVGVQHTLCYLDLDRFKVVNDTCGHAAGDELLRQISALLKHRVRKTDTVARLGGDEFVILLHQCPLSEATAVAQAIRYSVQAFRFIWQGKTFEVGISIGLIAIDAKAPNAMIAINQADAACYQAKYQGRNRIEVYDRDLPPTDANSTTWLSLLTEALETNQFQLYYQTILPTNPQGNSAAHFEILLRLPDANGVLRTPNSFMPMAERYNLMPAIDRWVIRQLFMTQAKQIRSHWQQCQTNGSVCEFLYAVNLSGASLNEEGLVSFIQEQLVCYAIPPRMICFEITETVAIANLNRAAQLIQAIRQLGCRFALDDFGTGMSSFGYLKSLPVDYLKIDGSFVKEIAHDPVAKAITDSINRIGHLMGLQTIAEWVEDEATLVVIQEIGLDYVQGSAIAEPQPLIVPTVAATENVEVRA
jgi:diguanylate cyclase (GGDEF)-like protein/PAS domain S-box-containing protein